jgi:3-hydroxyisobutyrate dehydrogenase
MGLPVAVGLHVGGYDVVAWDPDADARARAAAAGMHVASSAAEVAASVGVLMTVLPGAAELEDAVLPLLESLAPGSLWLDLTSGDPRVTRRVAALAEARGIATVDAAIVGGVSAATSRTLSFLVGGPSDAVARALPLLELLGTIDHVGEEPGSGQGAKLLGNLLWFGQVVAVTEALLLGQSMGIPARTLRRTLAAGPAGSAFINEYLDRLLAGDDLADFSLARCVEELDILAALARDADVPFSLSNQVVTLHREALERFGAIDGELLAARLLEERAGRQLG